MPEEKKYRVRVEFSCDVRGENPGGAIGNLTYALNFMCYTENVRNLTIRENGEIRTVPKVTAENLDADKAEQPRVVEAPDAETSKAATATDSDYPF